MAEGGEASTNALARLQRHQDPGMALLKSPSPIQSGKVNPTSPPSPAKLARGRDGYDLLNQVRTKPGQA